MFPDPVYHLLAMEQERHLQQANNDMKAAEERLLASGFSPNQWVHVKLYIQASILRFQLLVRPRPPGCHCTRFLNGDPRVNSGAVVDSPVRPYSEHLLKHTFGLGEICRSDRDDGYVRLCQRAKRNRNNLLDLRIGTEQGCGVAS